MIVTMRAAILVLSLVIPCFTRDLITVDEAGRLLSDHIERKSSNKDDARLEQVLELMHGSLNSLEDLSANRRTLLCVVCRSALSAIFSQVREGASEDVLKATFTNLCVRVGVTTEAVCRGAVDLNLPILKHIIVNTPEATPGSFCGLILQDPSNPNACPIEDPRFEYTVDIPPFPRTPVEHIIPNQNTKDLKVALITDAHLDPLYEAFGVANCDEPVCCRVGQRERLNYEYRSNFNKSILEDAFVDVKGRMMIDLKHADVVQRLKRSSMTKVQRSSEPAGYWGDYRNCDSPIWAYDDVIQRIAEDHQDIDLVYYMGDTIDHGVWETTYELIDDMNAHLIDKMKEQFGPNVPVIPVIGNHESQPTNQFAPPHIVKEGLNTHWLYEALARKWSHYLDARATQSLLDKGAFSLRIRNGLRVISLNTNIAYKWNWWVVYDPQEAKRHLEWLITELLEAERVGERVHILSHIPPGTHDLTHTWTREYNRIVNRFSSIILAEFNGHTHGDEFRIFYNSENQPSNMAWIVGAATAYTHYNLNYKIAYFNPNTYELQNFESYIYNLTEANLTPHRRPHWFQLYDFKNSFQLQDVSAVSMDALVHRMATTHRSLLDRYAAYFSRVSDARWPLCDLECKRDKLCDTVTTVLWERDRCERLLQLFQLYN